MTKLDQSLSVLVLAPTPYFSDRGCHIRIFEECTVLRSLGYQVQLVTYPLGRDLGDIQIKRTTALPWYRKTSAGPAWSKLLLDLFLALRAYQTCKQQRPSVIHAHLQESFWIGYLLKKRFRIPLILDLQSLLVPELRSYGSVWRWLAPALSWYERWAIKRSDVIVVSNQQAQQRLAATYPTIKIHLLADGISDVLQQPVETHYDVVYSGGLGKAKGTHLLFQALELVAKQLPHFKALMIAKPRPTLVPSYIDWIDGVPYEQLLPKLAEAKFGIDPKPLDTTEGSGKFLNYLAAGVTPITLPSTTATATDLANLILERLRTGTVPSQVEALKQQVLTDHSWKQQAPLLQSIYDEALSTL